MNANTSPAGWRTTKLCHGVFSDLEDHFTHSPLQFLISYLSRLKSRPPRSRQVKLWTGCLPPTSYQTETPLDFQACAGRSLCIREMFGKELNGRISKDLTIFLSFGLVQQYTSSSNRHLRLQDLSMKFSYPATATFWDDSRAFLPTLSLGLCRTQSFALCNREVPASFHKCSEQASSHVITKSVPTVCLTIHLD